MGLEEMQKNERLKLMVQEDREREEKRKAKTLRKMGLTEEQEMTERIGIEERKLLLAQRKLESIRLLDELLERVKATNKGKDEIKSLEKQMLAAHRKDVSSLVRNRKDSENLKDKEKEIREKLVMKLKRKAESNVSSQAGRVNKVKTGG